MGDAIGAERDDSGYSDIAPEKLIPSAFTGDGISADAEGGEPPRKTAFEEKLLKVAEKREKPAKKEKPVITRAKRRRSLLTEEEGGRLRRATVHRRSILGR